MKKKKFVSRWGRQDALTLAMSRNAPVPLETLAKVQAMRHAALVRLAEGTAGTADLTLMEFVAHLARELGRQGIGIEGIEAADRCQAVVDSLREFTEGETYQTEQPEYDLLQHTVEVLNLQMQSLPLGKYEEIQRKAIAAAQRAQVRLSEPLRP